MRSFISPFCEISSTDFHFPGAGDACEAGDCHENVRLIFCGTTMDEKKTCAVSERNTELSSAREIIRRLLFLFVAVGLPAGLIALAYGISQKSTLPVVVGAVLTTDAIALWLLRHRWGAKLTADEIRANPFRPACRPKQ
jgi:hypothetical protein